MNDSLYSMTNLRRAVATNSVVIPYGPPLAGLLPDPYRVHPLSYWRSAIREMERTIKKNNDTLRNAVKVIIDRKIDNHYKIHCERAKIIVLAPYYKPTFPFVDYRDIPIIYSLNLSTKEAWSEDSIQVF